MIEVGIPTLERMLASYEADVASQDLSAVTGTHLDALLEVQLTEI